MKKTLLSLIALLITAIAFAERVEIDGIYYNLNKENKTAEVTYQYEMSYNNYSGLTAFTIPSSITYNSETYNVTSIGYSAFAGCSSLTSVTIPNSVTSIGNDAFIACSVLSSITIPNSVTSIGNEAFYNCSALTSITIPNNVTSIGDGAFYECSSLTSITIPNNVTSIGSYAFMNCSSLTSITIPNNITSIGGYAFHETPWLNNQPDGCVYINNLLYTYKGEMPENTHIDVKEGTTVIIGAAFDGCSDLTSISIPNSVTYIGEYAFYYCSSLSSISIPNSVTSIGDGAFYECSSLTITINSTTPPTLGSNVFSNITTIIIPDNTLSAYLNSWGNYHIYINNETSLTINVETPGSLSTIITNIGVAPSNITKITITGTLNNDDFNYIQNDMTRLVDIDLSNITNTAGVNFQEKRYLKNILLPNSLTIIEDLAFQGCSSLTSITIPNSVTKVGGGVFYGCSSLESVVLSENISSLPKYYYTEFNGYGNLELEYTYGFFQGCTSLTSIEIPNSINSIGDLAFKGCSSLTSITIPNSVTEVGGGVFYGCSSLETVVLSENITSLRDFGYNSDWYNEYYYGFFQECTSLSSIEISQNVRSIDENTFKNCFSLSSISASSAIFNNEKSQHWDLNLKTVRVIIGELDENGFNFINYSKKSLHTIDLAGTTNTTINDMTFYNYYKLENLTLPANTETIGYMAFADCVHLKNLEIPATVVTIDERAFENCRSISSLTFAEDSNLKTIGAWAFYNNHNISEVTIPEGVTEIGDAAFYGCNYLENITLPASVQRIGDNGFALCNQVKRMEVRSTTPPTIEAKTFFQVSRDIEFIVPEEARNAYAEHEYWREFIQRTPTNVENTFENISIFTTNGTLHIEGAENEYQIHTATGQLVYSGNDATLSLPRGIYLVTIAGKTEKVVL